MVDRVFIRGESGELKPLESRSFSRESELDELLASCPGLLAEALSTEERPLRFLLVGAQAGIDDEEGRAGRWSADLLFLDSEGVLNVVEDKLSRNPDIRRKVLGQAIEYAANIANTLTVERIRQHLSNQVDDPDGKIAGLIDPDEDGEGTDFWQRIKINLERGALRLIFVADKIPRELRLAIEFLNSVTDPLEVAGIEVRQLGTGRARSDSDVVVASPVGVTERKRERSERSRGPGGRQPISVEEFLRGLGRLNDEAFCREAAEKLARGLLARSDRFDVDTAYRTEAGKVDVIRFKRKSDGLAMLEVRANSQLNRAGVLVKPPAWKWPDELRQSAEVLIGTKVGRKTVAPWLNEDRAREDEFLRWLLKEAET